MHSMVCLRANIAIDLEGCEDAVLERATLSWTCHGAGGKRGFDKVIWESERIAHPSGEAVRLTYTSKDGEEVWLPSPLP